MISAVAVDFTLDRVKAGGYTVACRDKRHLLQGQIARENGVGRPFVRRLRNKAHTAVNDCFVETDNTVLFTIPVTKKWIEQSMALNEGLASRRYKSCRGIGAFPISSIFSTKLISWPL